MKSSIAYGSDMNSQLLANKRLATQLNQLKNSILSDIITIKLHDHIGQYMNAVQKGTGNNTRGSKHQLLIESL